MLHVNVLNTSQTDEKIKLIEISRDYSKGKILK